MRWLGRELLLIWGAVIKLIFDRKMKINRKSVIQTYDKNFAKELILRKI